MVAMIKYDDGELKHFLDCKDVESYLAVLRQEVIANANNRTYEFFIGEHMKRHAHFKDGTLIKK